MLVYNERQKYSSAAITLGAIGLLNYAGKGKIPTKGIPFPVPAH